MKLLGSHVLILMLAAVSVIFGSGCTWDLFAIAVGYDPEKNPYLIIRCDQSTQTLQAYEGEDKGGLLPFGFQTSESPVDSPINGKPCSVSTENQNRPFSESEAIQKGFISPQAAPPSPSAAASHAVAQTTRLNDTFPHQVPLLFSPPFPISDDGKVARTCSSSLGSYLVNHTQGTVTSFGICPMHVIKEIPVRSHPLQLAVTPDGSTLLVTSYDSAVTFVDTVTDNIVSTLDLPGYNPSGIAISPDGLRAYVTHYFDINPSLLVIDVPGRRLLTTIPLPAPFPRAVVVTPDGAQAWVTYYASTFITVVDILSGSVSTSFGLPSQLGLGMAFNPTGTKAFIGGTPNNLYIIDTASLSILANIIVGGQPSDIVADPNGRDVFVNSGTQSGLWRIDAVNNKLAAPPASSKPGGSMGLLMNQ